MPSNDSSIDTFWEAYNSSRCKTAMLVISVIITIGFVIGELLDIGNASMQSCFIIIIGYWMGRTSKAHDLMTQPKVPDAFSKDCEVKKWLKQMKMKE